MVCCGKLSHVVVGVVGKLWQLVVATIYPATTSAHFVVSCGRPTTTHHNSPTTIVASCGGLWVSCGKHESTGFVKIGFATKCAMCNDGGGELAGVWSRGLLAVESVV